MDELPETLDGTYEQTLRGIDKQKRDYAYRLFQCLVVSKRPLRVEELGELFAIQPNTETIPTFDACLRPENPEEFVLLACSTLVAVVEVDRQKVVQFSHFSVREYLTSSRIANSEHVSRFRILPRPAHALLSRACLGVLLQLDVPIVVSKIRNFPLALYAAQHWVDHAQFQDVSSDIHHGMECLFDRNKPHFAAWLRLYNIDDSPNFLMATVHNARHDAGPLYYAALCGLRGIAEHLVGAHPHDVNARGGMRMTPLHAAVDKGHLSVVVLLVECGADMGSRDFRDWTPLHIASYRGYPEVVALLVDCGANLNAGPETPLHVASERGHDEIVRLLLDHGADANQQDNHGRTPLQLELERGHDEIVRLLLEYGADANQRDNHGRTPLQLELERGHDEIIRLLLDHGADANQWDNHGRNPLHFALERGHDDIVRSLLDHGADATRRDNHGRNPLHLALERGHDEIVRLLLNHGADANQPDNRGWASLHHASLRGHNDIVRLLLDTGADVNQPDDSGRTPLRLASLRGHNDIFQLLLDHGVVENHMDNRE